MSQTFNRFSIFAFLLLMFPVIVLGQNADAACRAFIDRAFSDLGQNCAGLEPNQACHGHGDVSATFYVDGQPLVVAEEFGELQEPGDQADIHHPDDNAKLENISGVPFVAPETPNEDGQWSIALLHTHGHLPQQLDDNVAMLFKFGDTTIETGTLPEDVFVLGEVVDVTVEEASIFTKPPGYTFDGFASEVIETVTDTFEADAISPDGAWVRVFFVHDGIFAQRSTAWLQVEDIEGDVDLSILPVLGPDDFAPKQDIYLQASTAGSDCDLVPPNGILVQGPLDFETDVRINELPIRFNSTAYIDKTGPNSMRVTVLSGVAHLNPGTEDEVIVAAGEETIVCLTDPLDRGIDGQEDDQIYDPECGIDDPVLHSSGNSFFNSLPSNTLHYPVPRVTIVRASGVGSPIVDIIITPPEAANRIRELCSEGSIPGQICDFLQ